MERSEVQLNFVRVAKELCEKAEAQGLKGPFRVETFFDEELRRGWIACFKMADGKASKWVWAQNAIDISLPANMTITDIDHEQRRGVVRDEGRILAV